jgi:hypothetical protein
MVPNQWLPPPFQYPLLMSDTGPQFLWYKWWHKEKSSLQQVEEKENLIRLSNQQKVAHAPKHKEKVLPTWTGPGWIHPLIQSVPGSWDLSAFLRDHISPEATTLSPTWSPALQGTTPSAIPLATPGSYTPGRALDRQGSRAEGESLLRTWHLTYLTQALTGNLPSPVLLHSHICLPNFWKLKN